MRYLNLIVIHCSDSDYEHHDNLESIYNWHVKERNFSDIGYHYVITKDGTVHKGRPLSRSGAHAKGYNRNSVGICLTGKHKFSPEQFEALCGLVDGLKGKYPKIKQVLGHCDVSSKTCPNFDYKKVLKDCGSN